MNIMPPIPAYTVERTKASSLYLSKLMPIACASDVLFFMASMARPVLLLHRLKVIIMRKTTTTTNTINIALFDVVVLSPSHF